MADTRCRTCRAPIVFAEGHDDARRLPYDAGVVEHTEPDTAIHVSAGGNTIAWTHVDLVEHIARRRTWSDTRAAQFIDDTFPAHRRHRCHQEPQ